MLKPVSFCGSRADRNHVINIISAPVKALMRPDVQRVVHHMIAVVLRAVQRNELLPLWSGLINALPSLSLVSFFIIIPPSQSSGTLTGSIPDPPSVIRTSSHCWMWFARCFLMMLVWHSNGNFIQIHCQTFRLYRNSPEPNVLKHFNTSPFSAYSWKIYLFICLLFYFLCIHTFLIELFY